MYRRKVCFGGARVEVQSESPVAGEIADYLFADVPGDLPGDDLGSVRIDRAMDGQWGLWGDGAQLYSGDSEAAATGMLLESVCNRFGEQCNAGLVLHAAAVTSSGFTVMLPGESGRGKTSTAAWLLHRGYDYLTDELCFIASGDDRVYGLARPLNVKSPAVDLLHREIGIEFDNADVRRSSFATLVPARLVGNGGVLSVAPVSVLVFPEYTPGPDTGLFTMTKSETAMSLLRSLVNVHRLGALAVTETNRLARSCPGYRLRYGSFSDLDNAVNRLRTGAAA